MSKVKPFDVWISARGVRFSIGYQGFTLANTELDPTDPESPGHQEFMAKMLLTALRRLAGESDNSSES